MFLGVRFDGEDAHLEHVLAGVFEQRRVAQLAHDIFVNSARPVRRHQLGFDRLAIDLHRELPDLGAFGHGEQECAFDALGVGIVKLLFNGGGGNLVVDADVGLVLRDLQRTKLVNSRGRNRPRLWPGSRSGAWQRPRWRDNSLGR